MTTIPSVPAALFTHYTVDRVLGQGAMGLVYKATDRRDNKTVALKTVSGTAVNDNPMEAIDYVSRMQREADLSKSLSHPNIIRFHDAGYDDGKIQYLAMEYIEGETLEQLIQREGALPASTVLDITTDLLSALSHAHERGVVHRDLKPANVLLTGNRRAKLADFGIARPEESTLTVAGQVLGTPAYTSPENITGASVTPRADLFSLGVVVYEMLSGKRPFVGRKLPEVLMAVVAKPAPPLGRADIPAEWEWFIDMLLKKNPDERFPSAAAALVELRDVIGVPGEPVEAAAVPPAAGPITLSGQVTAPGSIPVPLPAAATAAVPAPPPTPAAVAASPLALPSSPAAPAPQRAAKAPSVLAQPHKTPPPTLWERIKGWLGG